jgi:RNA polymerase sigma factor (sigma-70 family)
VDRRSLIARCIEKEPAAWAELVRTHRIVVLRVLVRTLGTGGAAAVDDLEQELWSRLLANRCEALRSLVDADGSTVRGFLYRAAHNLARDHRRRLGVRSVVQSGSLDALADELPDPDAEVEAAYERHERRRAILAALDQVVTPPNTDRDQMIFMSHYFDGLTAAEIAAMGVGLKPKGVETLLLRMVGRVRALLRAKNEDAA